jgi:hypothetical protein
MVESELCRSEGDLSGGAVVAAVHDGHGGRIVSLERWHDWTNENVDSAILEKQLFLILFTRTCNMLTKIWFYFGSFYTHHVLLSNGSG